MLSDKSSSARLRHKSNFALVKLDEESGSMF